MSVSGVNVWDEEWELGAFNASGTKVSDNTRFRSKNPIRVLPNTSYYLNFPYNWGQGKVEVFTYDANMNFISYNRKYNPRYTTPSNASYINFDVIGETAYNNDISINYPSTDTEYHALQRTNLQRRVQRQAQTHSQYMAVVLMWLVGSWW